VPSAVPLMTTTEDETNWLPFTARTTPCCTSANVIVVGEREPITGAGRVLPQRGLSALQPGKINNASRRAPGGRQESLIRFIRHLTSWGCVNTTTRNLTRTGRSAGIAYNMAMCTKPARGQAPIDNVLHISIDTTQDLARGALSIRHYGYIDTNPSCPPREFQEVPASRQLIRSRTIPVIRLSLRAPQTSDPRAANQIPSST
jgi:hypothetical protein